MSGIYPTLFDPLGGFTLFSKKGSEEGVPASPGDLLRTSSATESGRKEAEVVAGVKLLPPEMPTLAPISAVVPLRLTGLRTATRPRSNLTPLLGTDGEEALADVRQYLRDLLSAPEDYKRERDLLDVGRKERRLDALTENFAAAYDLARKFAQTSVSFLVWIGSVLDKPRAALAGLLAGQPSHLLHLLPFSEGFLKGFYEQIIRVVIPDFKGIPERRIYGRDLLEIYGLAPKREGHGVLFGGSISDFLADVLGLGLDFIMGGIVPYPAIRAIGKKAAVLGSGRETQLAAEAAAHAQAIGSQLARDTSVLARAVKDNFDLGVISSLVDVPLEVPSIARGDAIRLLRAAAESIPELPILLEKSPALARRIFLEKLSSLSDQIIRRELSAASSGQRILHTVSPVGAIEELTTGKRALVLSPGWPFDRWLTKEGYYTILWQPKGQAAKKTEELAQIALVENPVAAVIHGMFHWASKGVGRAGVSMAMQAVERARMVKSVITDLHAEMSRFLGTLSGRWQAFAHEAKFFGDNATGLTFDSLARYAVETANVWSTSLEDSAKIIARQILGRGIDDVKLQTAADIIAETVRAISSTHQKVQKALIDAMIEQGAPTALKRDVFGLSQLVRYGRGVFGGQTIWPTNRIFALIHPAGTVGVNRMANDPIVTARIGAPARTGFSSGYLVGSPAKIRVGNEDIYAVIETLVGQADELRAIRFWDGKRYYYALVPGSELLPTEEVLLAGATHVDDFKILAEPPVDVRLPRIFISPKSAEEAAKDYAAMMKWQIPEKADPIAFYVYKRYFEPIIELPEWKAAIHPILEKPNEILIPLIYPYGKAIREARKVLQSNPAIRNLLGLATKNQVNAWLRRGGVVGNLIDVLQRAGPEADMLFNRSLFETFDTMYYYASQRLGLLLASQEYAAKAATLNPQKSTLFGRVVGAFEPSEGAIPLTEAVKQITWFTDRAARRGGAPLTPQWVYATVRRWLERNGKRIEDFVPSAENELEALWKIAEQLYVPAYIPKQIRRVFHLKEVIEQNRYDYQNLWEWYLRTMRYWLTQVAPSFHFRNLVSGQVMNLTATDVPYTMRQYFDALKDVLAALNGRKPLPFGDEAEIAELISRTVLAADPTRDYTLAKGGLSWVFGPLAKQVSERVLAVGNWLFKPSRKAAEIQKAVKEKGTLGAIAQAFFQALEATTDRAYTFVETINRLTPYVAARRAGLSTSQALELVKRIQYDYSRLTPFEQRIMRPLFLFYGWQRSNLGFLIPRVTLESFSGAATVTRLLHALQQTAGELPAWMAETAAVPLRQTEEERERGLTTVIRRWGLHVEDLGLIHPTITGPGAVRMLQKTIAVMNPIIGTVFRLATGIEPYTGRPLKETAGVTGDPLLDAILTATPMARVGAMARTAMEVLGYNPYRRDWQMGLKLAPLLDLFTGIKTGEYDLDLQLLIDAREQLKKELEGSPYTRTGAYIYLPQHLKPFAPLWLAELVDRYRDLAEAAETLAKIRRGRDVVSVREVILGGD
ncbi:MAG: hypothetical protein RML36_15245 [Anaerolineae bacterium]|nr:hypothetical protein [Anaerolineae bacterium]